MDYNGELDFSNLLDTLSLHSISNPQTRMVLPSSENPNLKIFDRDPLEVLGERSFGEPRAVAREVEGTPVQEFLRDAHVLVTGGTGFVGKLLTEKLVRSAPHIGRIYILIRPKRGKSVQERFEALLEDRVFRRMKTEVPHYRKLILALEGDISEPNLGLDEHDHRLLTEKINVVFHGAADVRFIEPLRAAVESNVYGSRRVMELAKKMKSLKSYVHVSTAYSQCVRRVIPEAVPKMSVPYKDVLKEIDMMTDEELEKDLKRILQGWPNTYTFSKALCEEIVDEEADHLPISIFRPSAVVNTYREPVRGYTDNLYGPLGIFLGRLMGIIHCFPGPLDLSLDMVPVDYAVNCMITVAYRTVQRTPDQPLVYNFTATPHNVNGQSWKHVTHMGKNMLKYWPLSQAVYYGAFTITESILLDKILHFLFHEIPGKVLDRVAVMAGRKPILTKIYDKFKTVKEPLRYFTFNVWHFETDNVKNLRACLSDEDRKIFNFDVRDINLFESYYIGKLGLRYYYMKEEMETIPEAEVKYKRLLWLHRSVKLITGLAALKLCVVIAHCLPI